MINTSSPPLAPALLSNLEDKKESGNFMYRTIKWVRCTENCQTLRKAVAIVMTALLCCTLFGLFIVVPGIVEWNRQVNKAAKKHRDNTVRLNPVSASLAKFDNRSVKGEVNGLYITTNETNLAATDAFLKAHPVRENTIHVGCATWHNFDIMCKRKSNYGLIIDFNPENAKFIKKTVEIIKFSESREAFKTNVIAYLNSLQEKKRNIFFHKDQQGLPTDRIEKELFREGSWLQNAENYAYIKKLVSNDQIIAITENITNHRKFSEIRSFLDLNHLVIDTVYMSNICNFMQTKNDKEAFAKSVTSLVDDHTLFISCPKIRKSNRSQTKILHQCPILGSKMLEKGFCNSLFFEIHK